MNKNQLQGKLLAKGVRRFLRRSLDFQTLDEFVPTIGLRVDVMAIGAKGEIWIIECKSSRTDYMTDTKWENYLDFCDQFFWAVDSNFPHELLPEKTGLIFADRHDAEIIRHGETIKLASARRRAIMLKFARAAAGRYHIFSETLNRERNPLKQW